MANDTENKKESNGKWYWKSKNDL